MHTHNSQSQLRLVTQFYYGINNKFLDWQCQCELPKAGQSIMPIITHSHKQH